MDTGILIEGVMFWAFALVAVAAALGVLFHRSIVYSALFLITVFLSIAGLFVLNNADFLAIAQVLIYAVGLTIIILFAIMFTGDSQYGYDRRVVSGGAMAAFAIVGVYLVALLTRSAWYPFSPTGAGFNESAFAQIPLFGSTAEVGRLMFTKYALPFELASVLLLVAMIGAIVLSKRRFAGETDEPKYVVSPSTAPTDEALAARQAYWETYRYKSTPEEAMDELAETPEAGTSEEDEEPEKELAPKG